MNKRSVKSSKKGILATIMPLSVWMLAFFLVPLLLIVVVSFLTRGETGNLIYKFTLSNYTRLFDKLYLTIFLRSLIISIGTTALCLIFGYPFAFIVANSNKKIKPILFLLLILPFWTNSLIRTYAMIVLLRTEGIINTLLINIGIIKEPLKLLYNNFAVMVGMVYIMFPFMVLPLHTSIDKLDRRLLEAADDLGASPVRKFLNVTLPLTKSGILSGCMLVMIPTLGLFFITDLLGGSKVTLMSNLIKNQFLTARDWPFGSAISVVLIILMTAAMYLYTKLGGDAKKGGLL